MTLILPCLTVLHVTTKARACDSLKHCDDVPLEFEHNY
jgi:hypothetical protein